MSDKPLTPGIFNSGNTCYVNALLQIMARTEDFESFFDSYEHSGPENPDECLKCILQTLMRKMLIFPNGTMDLYATDLVNFLSDNSTTFSRGTPNDPMELLSFIIENIGVNPFHFEELKRVTCSSGCEGEATVPADFALGPALMVGFPTNENERVSSGGLIDIAFQQKRALTNCQSCGVAQSVERLIKSGPNFLLLMLERFPVANYTGKKTMRPCAVDRQIKVPVSNGDQYTYDFYGAISHIGENPNCGHYISHVLDNGTIFTYSDNNVTRDEIDESSVFLMFYKKTSDTLGFIPSTPSGCIQITNTQGKGRENDINRRRLSYSKKHIDGLRSEPLRLHRLLVICLPKCLRGDTFEEKYRTFLSSKNTILYTITYRGSALLLRLTNDSTITSDYEIYQKYIKRKMGVYTGHIWLAEAFLAYIIHTLFQRRFPRYELIFDLRVTGIVTLVLTKHFVDVKDKVLESLPRLLKNDLFCIDPCTALCHQHTDAFHYSIHDMKLVETSTAPNRGSWIEKLSFVDNKEALLHHPLEALLFPGQIDFTQDLECQVIQLINNVSLCQVKEFHVYMLLVVNGAVGHDIEDLKELYDNRRVTFGVYVGCTSSGRYRLDHLNAGSDTPVSNFLTPQSTCYLVISTKFEKFSEARNAEAKLIGYLLYKKEEARIQGEQLKYVILNRKHEFIPIEDFEDDTKRELKEFIASGKQLFRFIDPLDSTFCVDSSTKILKEYVVSEKIDY